MWQKLECVLIDVIKDNLVKKSANIVRQCDNSIIKDGNFFQLLFISLNHRFTIEMGERNILSCHMQI